MDVSIIQHAKDKAPRQMALDEVVQMMKGDAWPAGYQPLAVMASVVSGGVMRKHIRWLTGLGVCTITNSRQKICDDPHTLLCYTDGCGGCYVAYKYELNDRNSRFAVANLERQLVYRYFRKPAENEPGELVDTAMALQVISYNVGPKIYPDKVDAAFADLGFEERTVNGMSGYLAVRRKPEEIEALARLMAQEAAKQSRKT